LLAAGPLAALSLSPKILAMREPQTAIYSDSRSEAIATQAVQGRLAAGLSVASPGGGVRHRSVAAAEKRPQTTNKLPRL
jgi:hypothetical protein